MDRQMPVGRPTTLQERNNVECPECGSILTRSRGGGRDDNDHRLRRRRCEECNLLFCTVEVVVLYPDGKPVPFDSLVTDHRLQRRAHGRRKKGYHGTAAGRKPYVSSARMRVRVTVDPPVEAETVGPWPEDLAKRPSDPPRTADPAYFRRYREANRETIRAKNREWMRAKRAQQRPEATA